MLCFSSNILGFIFNPKKGDAAIATRKLGIFLLHRVVMNGAVVLVIEEDVDIKQCPHDAAGDGNGEDAIHPVATAKNFEEVNHLLTQVLAQHF